MADVIAGLGSSNKIDLEKIDKAIKIVEEDEAQKKKDAKLP